MDPASSESRENRLVDKLMINKNCGPKEANF